MAENNIDDIYGGSANSLKTADIPKGQIPEFTIKSVSVKEFGENRKLVLELDNSKVFVANKTNARQLAGNFDTPDYTKWVGRKFKVLRTTTTFQGSSVDCLRVV